MAATVSRLGGWLRNFSGPDHRSTTLLLVTLLLTDLGFLFIAGLQRFTSFVDHPLLVLTRDGGYPELFQYLKLFWTSFALLVVAARRRNIGVAIWSTVFAAFGLYDSLTIHERVGADLGERFLDRDWPADLQPSDIGEVLVQGLLAGLVVLAVALCLWRGPSSIRRLTGDLLLLIGALAVFGVAVDFIHALLPLGVAANFTAAFIEDGGEMIVVTVVFWYTVVFASTDGERSQFLLEQLPFRRFGRDCLT